jgi:hypothetical protein
VEETLLRHGRVTRGRHCKRQKCLFPLLYLERVRGAGGATLSDICGRFAASSAMCLKIPFRTGGEIDPEQVAPYITLRAAKSPITPSEIRSR